MPLFDMGKKKTPTLDPVPTTENGSPGPETEPKRPGTSGTEMLLTNNRRTASAQYIAAQRAEIAYKAKKRTAGAVQHRSEAANHFKQSTFHLKQGVKSSCKMMAAVPWMVRDWRAKRQTDHEKKAVEKYMEKKKKLEERIAKQELGKDSRETSEEPA